MSVQNWLQPPATALDKQMKLSNAYIQKSLTGVCLEELAFVLSSIRLQLPYLGFQMVTFLEMPPLVLLISPYHMQWLPLAEYSVLDLVFCQC
jgi:hypothetical protein